MTSINTLRYKGTFPFCWSSLVPLMFHLTTFRQIYIIGPELKLMIVLTSTLYSHSEGKGYLPPVGMNNVYRIKL